MSWNELINYPWENITQWIVMVVLIILLSVLLIVFGFIWVAKAPFRYNWRWGYKIFVARSGKQAWELANRMMGKSILIIGLISIPVSLFIMLSYRNQPMSTVIAIGCTIILIIMFSVFLSHILTKRKIERIYLSDVES